MRIESPLTRVWFFLESDAHPGWQYTLLLIMLWATGYDQNGANEAVSGLWPDPLSRPTAYVECQAPGKVVLRTWPRDYGNERNAYQSMVMSSDSQYWRDAPAC